MISGGDHRRGGSWHLRRWALAMSAMLGAASCGVLDATDDTTATLPPLTHPHPSTTGTGQSEPTPATPGAPTAHVATTSSPQPSSTPAAPTTPPAPTTPAHTTSPATTSTAAPSTTTDPALPPEVDVAAYAVLDVTSNRWLSQQEADAQQPVGSMMKLLTAYVALRHGEPDRTAVVPHLDQLGMSGDESKFGLYEGERASREVLFRLMLVVSASDAARVLATDISGTQEAFVDEMNWAAATLGLHGTYTDNPVGLDGAGSHSTAHDMALLAATLMQDPEFRQTVARTSVEWQERTRSSTNYAFLTSYPGAVGVKTGHTTGAGYCLAAAAERDGRLLVTVVLGAPSSSSRTDAVAALLDWGFRQP